MLEENTSFFLVFFLKRFIISNQKSKNYVIEVFDWKGQVSDLLDNYFTKHTQY